MNIQERLAVLETKVASLDLRITKMDEERGWLVKLVLGLVIAAVVGLVLNSGA
jgi:hypothetical protein